MLKREFYDMHVYPKEIVLNLMAWIMSDDLTRAAASLDPSRSYPFGCIRSEEIESKKARRNNNPKDPPFGRICINLKDAGIVNKNSKYAGTIKLEKWMTKNVQKLVIRCHQRAWTAWNWPRIRERSATHQ